jgi:hypothetical protein
VSHQATEGEQYLTSQSLKLDFRNAQSCSGLTGRTSGLPFCDFSYRVADDVEFVQWPVGDTNSEVYTRETLSVGDTSIVIFRHESLTPEQVLERLVHHYKAWTVNKPSGRL